MSKTHYLIIFYYSLLSVIPCLNVQGQESISDFMYTGNTVRYNQSTIGSGSNTLGGAVQLTPEKLKLLKGNEITAIRFYQSGSGMENAKVFVTTSLDHTVYDYEQAVTSVTSGWNEIELSQPFSINGTELFIGYEIKAQNPALGTNSNTENGLNDWYLQNGEWGHINTAGTTRAMCITGIVRGDKLPHYNIQLVTTDLPFHRYEQTLQPFTLKAYIFNEAVETIHNATLQVSVNGLEPVTKTVTGLDIPYLSSDTIEIEGVSIPEEGEYPCVLTVTRLNGNDDLDMSNNSSAGEIFSRFTFIKRNILIENFSTEKCMNCPAGHKQIEKAIEGNANVIMATHHSGYGTDDFTIEESKAYTCFYKTQFAPAFMLDRTNLGAQGGGDQYGESPTPVTAIRNDLTRLIDYALKVPAFATIGLDVQYDEVTRKLMVMTEGQSVLPISGSDSRLNIYITEDSVVAIKQNGATGRYLHNQTLRKVLTGTWGENIDLVQGFTSQYETVLPEEWNEKYINVVAFLSNFDETDLNNRMIYNSATRQIFSRSGINEKTVTDNEIKVYIENGHIQIAGEYKTLEIYDITGKRIDKSALNAGIYLFKFRTKENNLIIRKAVIPNQY